MLSSRRAANPKKIDLAKQLARYVTQCFYTDDVFAVMDVVIRNDYITFHTSDPLHYKTVSAGRLETRTEKWMRERLKILCNDHMILKDEFGKREYFYIDFAYFLNVMQYRKHLLYHKVAEKQESKLDVDKYRCGLRCHDTEYMAVDVIKYENMSCPVCGTRQKGKLISVEITRATTRQRGLVKKLQTQLEKVLLLMDQLAGSGKEISRKSPKQIKEEDLKLRKRGVLVGSQRRQQQQQREVLGISKGTAAETEFANIDKEGRLRQINYEHTSHQSILEAGTASAKRKRGASEDILQHASNLPFCLQESSITGRAVNHHTASNLADGTSEIEMTKRRKISEDAAAEERRVVEQVENTDTAAFFLSADVGSGDGKSSTDGNVTARKIGVLDDDEWADAACVEVVEDKRVKVTLSSGDVVAWEDVVVDELNDDDYAEYFRVGQKHGFLQDSHIEEDEDDDDF
jgi:hypothetical protein